jgi:hypothetical protein
MPKKESKCKPSGYDVVIRNSVAIKKLNRAMDKASLKKRGALIDEKDRLMHEMWKACPHESVADGETMTRPGPGAEPIPNRFRFCTSCGFDEAPSQLKILVPRQGRTIARLESPAFSAKLGETLRRTGINL